MKMFTYRFWHPVRRNWLTLDCPAVDREAAQRSALRFINRENRWLRRVMGRGARQLPVPNHPNFLREEPSQ